MELVYKTRWLQMLMWSKIKVTPTGWNKQNGIQQNGIWGKRNIRWNGLDQRWSGLEQNSQAWWGRVLWLKEVRSINDPSAALKPVLVALDLHIGCSKHTHTHTLSADNTLNPAAYRTHTLSYSNILPCISRQNWKRTTETKARRADDREKRGQETATHMQTMAGEWHDKFNTLWS